MTEPPSTGQRDGATVQLAALTDPAACLHLLHADATLTLMDSDQVFIGPDEICGLFANLHHRLFVATSRVRDARERGNQVTIEATLEGVQATEFAGVQPAGSHVTMHYVLTWELADGLIRAIRAYWNLDELLRQLRDER
jgi:ketosteroid isomerase-like protein